MQDLPAMIRRPSVLVALLLGAMSLGSCRREESPKTEGAPKPVTNARAHDIAPRGEARSDCGFEDGTYQATIDYFNPDTNYSATYTLPAEVEDCEITSIDFNNGGYLADYHFGFPAELDDNGNAEIHSDRGQDYTIHLDSRPRSPDDENADADKPADDTDYDR